MFNFSYSGQNIKVDLPLLLLQLCFVYVSQLSPFPKTSLVRCLLRQTLQHDCDPHIWCDCDEQSGWPVGTFALCSEHILPP